MVITMNKVNFSHQIQEMDSSHGKCRDPGELNRHTKVVWSAIVAEPDTLHSPDWVWKVSKTVFAFTQAVTYKVLTIIFAPLLAFIIALHFAMLSFSQIWCANPINRFLHVGFSSVRTFLEILSNAIFGPIIETIGLCLSKLKIRHQRIYDAKDESLYPFII